MPVYHNLYVVQYEPASCGWKSPPAMESNCVSRDFQVVRFDSASGVALIAMDRDAMCGAGTLLIEPDLETANWLAGIARLPKELDENGVVTMWFTAQEEQAMIDAKVKAMG